ncbi:TIGR03086 family metal-binding protein [Amycolatopsis magusensis]|uniref:TIGR03086 family metal-binding protein n=1 Tax=Amycolatopsis magusensis TaxID=882444 RepID=UPI0024A7CBB4|nr:TIGR03086 family metal-binding protein [Amycolatopsis magusensis]MDI5979994.1 TIGR03086 family metal-binding protein [Amycolatopsis magusensis]
MTTQPVHDPRRSFAQALDQTARQIAATRPDELGKRTPCADYDVRALLGHLIAVLHKLVHVSVGGDARELPDVVRDIADDAWGGAFAEARGQVERAWADDAMLDRMVTLPWGTMPGRVALDAYTHEFTVHSWDLAHATGRLADLEPALAVEALQAFVEFAPPDERGEQGPFGPVVQVSEDAAPYTRLAAYLGRQP